MKLSTSMLRLKSLRKIRRAVQNAPALGARMYFDSDGKPCCAIGHGLVAMGYGSDDYYRTSAIPTLLGITPTQFQLIWKMNDVTPRENRKERVIALIDSFIAAIRKQAEK